MIKGKIFMVGGTSKGGAVTKIAAVIIALIAMLSFLLLLVFIGVFMLALLPAAVAASWLLKRRLMKALKERGPIQVEYNVEKVTKEADGSPALLEEGKEDHC